MAEKNKTVLFTTIKKLKHKKTRFRGKCNNSYNSPLKLQLVRYLQSEWQSSTTHGLPYIVHNRFHYLENIISHPRKVWFELIDLYNIWIRHVHKTGVTIFNLDQVVLKMASPRAFWIGCLFVCISVMIVLLSLQYLRFVAAPTVMSVERNYFDWNISYPAITLCPLYKADIIKFGEFVNDTFETTGLNIKGYLWTITHAALDNLEFLDYNFQDEILQLIEPENYAKVSASLFRDFGNGSLSSNFRMNISVDAATTELGMCHVINSNVAIFDKPLDWNNDAVAAASYVKKNVELSIFEADLFTVLADYAPIYMVYIHGPNEVTLASGSSFVFDVEGAITFGLSVWSTRVSEELRYKPLRIRKCRFIHEPISNRYPVYSFNHCMLECRIKMILRLCGCVPHFYKPLNSERVCHITELKCVLKYRKEIMTLKTLEETSKNFCNTKDLPKMSRDCNCLNSCELDLYYKDKEDYIPQTGQNKLKIKITSFPKVRVVRDVIFGFYDIVLKSGGVMNLCIGSSLISLVEFLLTVVKSTILFC